MIQFSFRRSSRRIARTCAPQVLAGRKAARQRGFTLIEVMVALAILSLLLVILFVPLNLGVNMTQIGTANADTQQAAQTTMNRIVRELSRATFVFPNQRMVGITDKAPYTNNVPPGSPPGTIGFPYYEATGTSINACDKLKSVENTSRLDFLLPRRDEDEDGDANDVGLPPTDPRHDADDDADRRTKGFSIVTYYARRDNLSTLVEFTNPLTNYDGELNPLGLFRTRLPYKSNDGNLYPNANMPQALVDNRRYPNRDTTASDDCSTNANRSNSGARWLVQDQYGEPLLKVFDSGTPDSIGNGATNTLPFSDSRITPKGAGLYAPGAGALPPATPNLKPETTFICEDTNNNGIIDRVTITLVLGKYDNNGSQNRAQTVRLTRTVDLPNTETRFGGS